MIQTLSTSNEIKEFLGYEPLQSASFRVTMACNLRCKQCYARAGRRIANELTFAEIKRLLDELKVLGAIRIFFTGGEPFARPDMFEILQYADNNNFAMYISTNGTLICPDVLDRMASLKHLRTFQISIDGLHKIHDKIRGIPGTFDRAIKTINLATKKLKNTKVAIISTLMKNNYEEMEKIYQLAIDLGVDTFGIVPLYPVKRSADAIDVTTKQKHELFQKLGRMYHQKKTKLKLGLLMPPALIPKPLREIEYGCGYVCSFPSLLGIHANGDVAPCDGLLSYRQFILGNVREKSLEEIWNHPIMMNLRRIGPNDLKGVCRKCKFLSFCMGGCRARSYLNYGNFVSSNPICESFYNCGYFPKESIQPS